MDRLYSLYSMSPNNRRLLDKCASELDIQVRKIGKILDVRWVASSFRAVKAVWDSYAALHHSFTTAASDMSKASKVRAEFSGLAKQMESGIFLQNLALMHDALQELADLSEALQFSTLSLSRAHRLILRQIDVFKGRKEMGGECVAVAVSAVEEGLYSGITLRPVKSTELINRSQFYQALVDSMNARLLPQKDRALCDLINAVLPNQWPEALSAEHGEHELKALCERFLIPFGGELKTAYREYKDSKGCTVEHTMRRVISYVETLPVSTAECERGFSRMNLICDELRSTITMQHLSALMFVSLVGPPLHVWNPETYVRSWLAAGRRSAAATDCLSRRAPETTTDLARQFVWKLL